MTEAMAPPGASFLATRKGQIDRGALVRRAGQHHREDTDRCTRQRRLVCLAVAGEGITGV